MTNLDKILSIKRNNIKPSSGKILISEPFLKDFYFKKSVVLLADHNEEGSFGVILNKPVKVKLNEITKDFPEFDVPVYLGGPLSPDNLFYIHTMGDKIDNSVKIIDGLHWGGDIEAVKELIHIKQLSPNNIRFYIGYSGWAEKQLDKELKEDSWIVAKASANIIFNDQPQSMWNEAVKKLGKDYALWLNFPDDPILN